MIVQAQHKKFTADQYYQMAESGILTQRDRVELIEGEIIQMAAIGKNHAVCVDRLTELFVLAFSSQALIRVQNPVRLSNYSEPQPDFAILRLRQDFYLDGHPQPEDVLAVVEVSDSSIDQRSAAGSAVRRRSTADYDRGVKAPLYAGEGIQELWIIDLNVLAVEVYRLPSSQGYQQVQTFQRGESVAFQAFPNVSFQVEQLLIPMLGNHA